jgi:hypothetical protein
LPHSSARAPNHTEIVNVAKINPRTFLLSDHTNFSGIEANPSEVTKSLGVIDKTKLKAFVADPELIKFGSQAFEYPLGHAVEPL